MSAQSNSKFPSSAIQPLGAAHWDEEHLFFDGDSYFRDLFAQIDLAKESVEFETYIYSADEVGLRLEQALIAAAMRGVTVRLLVDGIGASGWFEKISPELDRSGVHVRVYHPVQLSQLFSFWPHKNRGPFFARLNRRNHRKVCVIDGKIAWVGSVNVTGNHSATLRGPHAWRDTIVRIRGAAVEDLQTAFDYAWLRSRTLNGRRRWRDLLVPIATRGRPDLNLVRLNYTQRLRRQHSRDLLERLRVAQHEILLTNAYFAPSTKILRELLLAAQRGVRVRILVPRESDVFFMPWVARAHYDPLLRSGAEIYEYVPRFLHAKSIVIDDWATVGSSNMNRRSFYYDFEVDIVLTRLESLMALRQQFGRDLKNAEQVQLARQSGKMLKRPVEYMGGLTVRLVGRLITQLFKNWI